MNDKMIEIIESFFTKVAVGEIEIYNEFSLQHELGIFLKEKYKSENKKIQFERNVSYFFPNQTKSEFEKKEIDISIFNKDKNNLPKDLSCVMELKYPKNGQYPETMYSFCKDIVFLEQLIKNGFKEAYFIAVSEDKLFYSASKRASTNGIYGFFRNNKPITGKIQKPTGSKDKKPQSLTVNGTYYAEWKSDNKNSVFKYCIIKIV